MTPVSTFKLGAVAALKKFKAEKTFRKTDAERLESMRELVKELSKVYGIPHPLVDTEDIDGSFSGESTYHPYFNIITMRGKLSIITLLHEFGHALKGKSETKAQSWAVGLFKKVYPKQFEKLETDGHFFKSPIGGLEEARARRRAGLSTSRVLNIENGREVV